MKIASNTIGLIVRLGAMAAVLLLGQQALAAGTRAGTVIDNTASVDYFVGGIDQTDITSNTVSFVVDRRVSFTLLPVSTPDLLTVTPGQNDVFVDFLLSNLSNSDLDFDLVLAQVLSGTIVDGTAADDADIGGAEYAVSTQTVSGGDADPAQGGPQFVDNLPADESIRIRVWGDVDLTMTDGQVAGLELTATAEDTAGTALAYGVANTDGLENVDVNGNNGVQVSNDGFLVETAALTAAKSYSVIADPLGSGLAIPGARLQYEIVVSNAAGGADATNVVISDTIDGDVTFLDNGSGSDFTDIQVDDGGGPVECTASGADNDGCSVAGGVLTVGDPADRPITISAGGSYTVRFQVLIPDPTPTP